MFREGQKVILVDGRDQKTLQEGQIYTVRKVAGGYIYLDEYHPPHDGGWMPHRFAAAPIMAMDEPEFSLAEIEKATEICRNSK